MATPGELYALLHEGADVESVCESNAITPLSIYERRYAEINVLVADEANTTHFPGGHKHFIDRLRNVCLKHQGLLNLV